MIGVTLERQLPRGAGREKWVVREPTLLFLVITRPFCGLFLIHVSLGFLLCISLGCNRAARPQRLLGDRVDESSREGLSFPGTLGGYRCFSAVLATVPNE